MYNRWCCLRHGFRCFQINKWKSWLLVSAFHVASRCVFLGRTRDFWMVPLNVTTLLLCPWAASSTMSWWNQFSGLWKNLTCLYRKWHQERRWGLSLRANPTSCTTSDWLVQKTCWHCLRTFPSVVFMVCDKILLCVLRMKKGLHACSWQNQYKHISGNLLKPFCLSVCQVSENTAHILPSSDPTAHLLPNKTKDFTAFINLVDFCRWWTHTGTCTFTAMKNGLRSTLSSFLPPPQRVVADQTCGVFPGLDVSLKPRTDPPLHTKSTHQRLLQAAHCRYENCQEDQVLPGYTATVAELFLCHPDCCHGGHTGFNPDRTRFEMTGTWHCVRWLLSQRKWIRLCFQPVI